MTMIVIDFLVTYGTPFVLGVMLAEILLELGDLREYKREQEERERRQKGSPGHDETSKAYSQIPQDRPIPMEHEHDD